MCAETSPFLLLNNSVSSRMQMRFSPDRFVRMACLSGFLLPLLLLAQLRPGGWSALGTTFPIHPDYPALVQPAYAVSLGLSQAVDGSRAWHHLFRQPRLRYEALWYDPGNPAVLGQALSAAIWLDLELARGSRWTLRYAFGKGPSFMTRPQDRRRNPTNIAYAGRLTDLTALQVYLRRQLAPTLALDLGVTALHYSSAQVTVPNLGLNSVGLHLGLQGLPRSPLPLRFVPARVLRRGLRPALRLGHGFAARIIDDGPVYAVYTLMPYLTWQPWAKLRLAAGGKAFYHDGLYEFYETQDFGVGAHRRLATGVVAWVGAEWLLGHLGINLKLGPFLKRPLLMDHRLYTELGLQYYWWDTQQRDGWQPFLGLYVHAHSGQADWGELALGVSF